MDDLDRILDLARWYPSPHNSQPMVVGRRRDGLDLYYDLDRGLPAEPYGVPFSFVCAGTFIETLNHRGACAGLRRRRVAALAGHGLRRQRPAAPPRQPHAGPAGRAGPRAPTSDPASRS